MEKQKRKKTDEKRILYKSAFIWWHLVLRVICFIMVFKKFKSWEKVVSNSTRLVQNFNKVGCLRQKFVEFQIILMRLPKVL